MKTIIVRSNEGTEKEVQAYKVGKLFAIIKDLMGRGYRVTHLNTGASVGFARPLKEARALFGCLEGSRLDWNFKDPQYVVSHKEYENEFRTFSQMIQASFRGLASLGGAQ